MLIHSLQRGLEPGATLPVRQNRRMPLIEAALAPAARDRLVKAMALVIGTESRVAFKDVLRLEDEAATAIRLWMIEALVDAARR
jgi:hypothetical protein